MKKKGMWAVIGVGVYLAVLKLLVYAESFSPESSIRSLKDALWYGAVAAACSLGKPGATEGVRKMEEALNAFERV